MIRVRDGAMYAVGVDWTWASVEPVVAEVGLSGDVTIAVAFVEES